MEACQQVVVFFPSKHPQIESFLPNKTEIPVGPSGCSFQDQLWKGYLFHWGPSRALHLL